MVRTVPKIDVRQNQKTKYLCLTDLNRIAPDKHLINWRQTQQTQEFIQAVCDYYGLSEDEVINDRKRSGKETWAHPLIFLDFAMWLSPQFKVKALEWLSDYIC
ncbi:MAG: KilA-N domain-containing protein [Nitrososphaerales archaeon]